jgi:hypothetical protein
VARQVTHQHFACLTADKTPILHLVLTLGFLSFPHSKSQVGHSDSRRRSIPSVRNNGAIVICTIHSSIHPFVHPSILSKSVEFYLVAVSEVDRFSVPGPATGVYSDESADLCCKPMHEHSPVWTMSAHGFATESTVHNRNGAEPPRIVAAVATVAGSEC